MRWVTQFVCAVALVSCIAISSQSRLNDKAAGAWAVASMAFGIIMICNSNISEN